MAQQIKKKFIQNDAVDSTKIKLLKDQAVRGQKQDGSEVELLKLDGSDKLVHDGQEIAFKSQLDSEEQARIAGDESLEDMIDSEAQARMDGDSLLQSNLDQEVSDLEASILVEKTRAEGEESRIESKFDEMMSDEQSAREQGDSGLQSQINTEKGRVDAILLASQADKDSFAEIVQLINSVDTENDSAFASYVLSNNAALAQEVSDRQAADAAEVLARDAAISVAVMAEQQARELFDGMFDSRLTQEVSDRQAGDQQLSETISSTATSLMGTIGAVNDRAIAAEQELQSQIDAEESRAMGVESSLQSQITQEVSARQSADTTLQSNIDAEEVRAMGVEAELQSDLENLDGYAQDIRSDLDQEILDRQSADSTEQAARIAGDSALQSSLNSEISARQSADQSLQSSISSEVSARIAGDASTLQSSKDYTDGKISLVMSNLDTEALDSLVEIVSAFQSADGNLNNTISDLSAAASSALAAEVSRATLAEQGLQSDIDAEVSARELADEQLQSNIDGKVSKSGDEMTGDYSMTGAFNFSGPEGIDHVAQLSYASLNITIPEGPSAGNTDVNAGFIFLTGNDGSASMPVDPSHVTTKAYVDEQISMTSDSLSQTIEDEISSVLEQLSQEISDREAADESINQQLGMHLEDYNAFRDDTVTDIGNLSSRIDALEIQQDGPYFNKMKFVIDESSELSSVELSHECMENSLVVCVGRLMVHKDEDFSVSVVDGKSVLTWMGDFATGGSEAIEEGDVIFVTYAREV
jgi:hypothetical protein